MAPVHNMQQSDIERKFSPAFARTGVLASACLRENRIFSPANFDHFISDVSELLADACNFYTF